MRCMRGATGCARGEVGQRRAIALNYALSLQFINIFYKYRDMEGYPVETSGKESKPESKDEGNVRNLIMEKMDNIQSQIQSLRKDIQFSITPKFLEISTQANDLVEFAIELWRMERRLNKAMSNLPEDQKEMLNNSMQKMKRYLDRNDIEILDHTNQKYDEGQNLEILAVENDPNAKEPTIKETKEPTILYKGQVIHIGKVIIVSNKDIE